MTKLLNRPLQFFTFYALLILAISVPIYALVVDHIWVTELDENNWLTLQHTKTNLQSRNYSMDEINQINEIWGQLQPGLSITPTQSQSPDSTYEIIRKNHFDIDDEIDRFRGLKSSVFVNNQWYELRIETNVEESDETFLAIAIVTFAFFIILIFGFILLNRSLASKTWKPFYNTLEKLKKFELSRDSSISLNESNIEEFHELNQSLKKLINDNVKAYQGQKSFIENASHELQTPIALLKSRIDLILQLPELSPELSALINGIEAPLSRLTRINKNLLLLAKVKNQQYAELESIEIGSLLNTTLQLFEDYMCEKEHVLKLECKTGVHLKANAYLLETLIHNLTSNAIRHSEPGAEINIYLDENGLTISNSGINALDTSKLFQRFSSLSDKKVTNGLGLAIIKEIVEIYDWGVEYLFEHRMHHFIVRFNLPNNLNKNEAN